MPLLLTPTLLLPLLSPEEQQANALSIYLARSLAITQLALAGSSLLLSGFLPLSALSAASPEVMSAFRSPMVTVTMFFHAAAAFHCYAVTADGGGSAYILGAIGSGFLAALGIWVLLFGGESVRKSKKTGGDKRTSRYPFGDKKGRREALKKGEDDGIELKEL
jgi:hypothetical protein